MPLPPYLEFLLFFAFRFSFFFVVCFRAHAFLFPFLIFLIIFLYFPYWLACSNIAGLFLVPRVKKTDLKQEMKRFGTRRSCIVRSVNMDMIRYLIFKEIVGFGGFGKRLESRAEQSRAERSEALTVGVFRCQEKQLSRICGDCGEMSGREGGEETRDCLAKRKALSICVVLKYCR